MIKESMIQDKKRESEYTDLLKDYVYFLKGKILHKNKLLQKYNNRLQTSYRNEDIETMLPHDNNVANNKKDESPLYSAGIPNELDNDSQITPKEDSLSSDENESILIKANNSNGNVYVNYEKDDVCHSDKLIDNKWITVRRNKKYNDVTQVPVN